MCVGRFLREFERLPMEISKTADFRNSPFKIHPRVELSLNRMSDYSIRHLDFLQSAFLHRHSTEEAQCHAEFLRAYRQSLGGLQCRDECWISFLGGHAVVGNSSDAIINGRPMKKRPLLASVTLRRSDGVINQSVDILFRPIIQKRFLFNFPRRT